MPDSTILAMCGFIPFSHWVGIYNCLYEHSLGGHYSCEVAFETTPGLIRFMHYTLWYPVYYFDAEEKSTSTKEHYVVASDYSSIIL